MPDAPASSKPVCLDVDILMCQIPKVKKKEDRVLKLLASFDEGYQLHITHVEGGGPELASSFAEEPDLLMWVDGLYGALCPIMSVSGERGVNGVLPYVLGDFKFRKPGNHGRV